MGNELWAALIGAVVLLLTNTAAAIKMWAEIAKQKADRAETKIVRDKESTEVRDSVQQLKWDNARLKEDLMMVKTHLDDHQLQLSNVVTEIAKLGVKMDNVLDALNKLQETK